MSFVDETIRLAGRAIKVDGNDSYATDEETGQDAGKNRLDPLSDYEVALRVQSDSGIVEGSLLIDKDLSNLLAIVVEPKRLMGVVQYYRVKAYRCNSVVKVYGFNKATNNHSTLLVSDVPCLIIKTLISRTWKDDAAIATSMGGNLGSYQIFAQASSGIKKDSVLVDASNRRFRLKKEFDIFFSLGILSSEVTIES